MDPEPKKVILSTAWYQFKAKFDKDIYRKWIHNMLSNVNNYKLVVYTNEESNPYVLPYTSNPNIKLVIKEEQEFYGYKYKKEWKANHERNELLNQKVDWRVNMLWNEKVHFVYETVTNGYFVDANETGSKDKTETIYGWCDIGYFRCRTTDITQSEISGWPNPEAITKVKINSKIYYARVNNDSEYIKHLFTIANTKSAAGMPVFDIPPTQNSIAGGFFLISKANLLWFREEYDKTLKRYFFFNTLIKDDQIILVDVIFSNMARFTLIQTKEDQDKWFQFQRFLR